ncbi:hypothetical protein KY285_024565 [Solanum tuberosum]|nr:hypothetical protein KY285_024565 [Solanum tuberosum]
MREKVRGKNTFSLCEIRKWRTHSILWVHRIRFQSQSSAVHTWAKTTLQWFHSFLWTWLKEANYSSSSSSAKPAREMERADRSPASRPITRIPVTVPIIQRGILPVVSAIYPTSLQTQLFYPVGVPM